MTYYIVGSSASLATITQAAALAVAGDVIVVPAGTYTEDFTLAYGVTLRAAANEVVTIVGLVSLTGTNNLRGLVFQKGASDYTIDLTLGSGTAWFDQCTFYPQGTYGTFAQPLAGTVTFNRCLFTDVGIASPTYFARDYIGGADSIVFYSNVFTLMNPATSGGFLFADPAVVDVMSNTFILQHDGSFYQAIRTEGAGLSITRKVRYNVLVRLSGDTGGMNFVDDNLTNTIQYNRAYGYPTTDSPGHEAIEYDSGDGVSDALDATNVVNSLATVANLVDAVNGVPGIRAGNIPVVARATPGPTVDFNGFAFASNMCFGAIQSSGENSAIYQPWYDLDILAGITFKYSPDADPASGEATIAPDASMLGERTFNSPIELTNLVNAYIQDVAGPGGAVFYVDYLGNYRLKALAGNFCLTISGDAALVFGSATYTNSTDTG